MQSAYVQALKSETLKHTEKPQWLNYSKVGGGTLHFVHSLSLPSPHPLSFPSFPSAPFPFPPLPFLHLEVGPLNPAIGGLE